MGRSFELIHLGGEHTVTGSCHLLRAVGGRGTGANILIDCGSSQGSETVVPFERWPVPPAAGRRLGN